MRVPPDDHWKQLLNSNYRKRAGISGDFAIATSLAGPAPQRRLLLPKTTAAERVRWQHNRRNLILIWNQSYLMLSWALNCLKNKRKVYFQIAGPLGREEQIRRTREMPSGCLFILAILPSSCHQIFLFFSFTCLLCPLLHFSENHFLYSVGFLSTLWFSALAWWLSLTIVVLSKAYWQLKTLGGGDGERVSSASGILPRHLQIV